MALVRPNIVMDPEEILQVGIDYITSVYPSWRPDDGQFSLVFLRAIAYMISDLAALAADVPDLIYQIYGQLVVGIPLTAEAYASANVTLTLAVAAPAGGLVVPAGVLFAFTDANGTQQGFTTRSDTTFAAAATTAVNTIWSVLPGAEFNGLAGTIDVLSNSPIASATLVSAATAGGLDEEDEEHYMTRLTQDLQLLANRVVNGPDAAALAQENPNVFKALGVDKYDPADGLFTHDKTLTVALADVLGGAVASGVKTDVTAALAAAREFGFVFHVVDPVYQNVDVNVTYTVQPGWDVAEVGERLSASILAYVNPANWGLRNSGDLPLWIASPTLPYLQLAQIIWNTEGVSTVPLLQVRKHGAGTWTTADVTYSGTEPYVLFRALAPTDVTVTAA